ncbi:hypothetical protein ACN38_g6712 [Penicillium nordicum]|uniref:Uncharacterized protein n=1 Tax=Penicillium nordicum TaxID=229535 RepID=A0A0M9WF19_9EURO|nr:hypothetical protein ACN38_g6712 [Penicillium nordicum]
MYKKVKSQKQKKKNEKVQRNLEIGTRNGCILYPEENKRTGTPFETDPGRSWQVSGRFQCGLFSFRIFQTLPLEWLTAKK